MKALALEFVTPLRADEPRPNCLKACPAGTAVWTLLGRLKEADKACLHGGVLCHGCKRWVNVSTLGQPKERPESIQ